MNININNESIFKVICYTYKWHNIRKLRYPTSKVSWHEYAYFKTLDEVELHIQRYAQIMCEANKTTPAESDFLSHYAFVVLEIPLGSELLNACRGENLSVRIYLPNGTLWGIKPYADFSPKCGLNPDGYNYWGRRNLFWGREPEEIRQLYTF